MEIRNMTAADLKGAKDIDATAQSAQYLHVERSGEGLSISWKTQMRPLREKRTHRHPLGDEQEFAIKQIVTGADEGVALVAEHEGRPVAAAAARPDPLAGVLRLIDLRVDFEFRRQGLASALMFQMIHEARRKGLRAIAAESAADDFPALQLLAKLGFEPAGLDTHYRSNHDLVKESVILFFYLTLN
ncbi:MAG TPA: GNAT family N-acetyltransferase [Tepidisphaeraceae bacterium]|nr:GNAT family N-acetyltransferase [Tepidisphaeraceae bacterium]